MIDDRALCARFTRLELTTLHRWIDQGWVRPRRQAELLVFDETDVARVALLCDLTFEIEIAEESLPVVLSLLDQVYDLRRQMGAILAALSEQPPELRERLQAAIARQGERPEHRGQ